MPTKPAKLPPHLQKAAEEAQRRLKEEKQARRIEKAQDAQNKATKTPQ